MSSSSTPEDITPIDSSTPRMLLPTICAASNNLKMPYGTVLFSRINFDSEAKSVIISSSMFSLYSSDLQIQLLTDMMCPRTNYGQRLQLPRAMVRVSVTLQTSPHERAPKPFNPTIHPQTTNPTLLFVPNLLPSTKIQGYRYDNPERKNTRPILGTKEAQAITPPLQERLINR